MEWKLELVPVPVSDIDRAKRFYSEQVGFAVDHDTRVSDEMRIVQLTPPGSACSIVLGVETGTPGSLQGMQLVVADVEAARAELVQRGVETSEIQHFDGAVRVAGRGAKSTKRDVAKARCRCDGCTLSRQSVTAHALRPVVRWVADEA